MKIKKAIITCAGFGTRFLPITKTIQKEMLPILNRPMIDFVVSDCIAAGIEEIIFVVKEHENKLVEHFYTESDTLEKQMSAVGQAEKYLKANISVPKNIRFNFITQVSSDGYGTAIPVKLAEKYVENEEAFLVFMGDDFIYNPNRIEASEMIQLFQKSGAQALVTCITKPEEELYRYGVAETRNENGYTFLTNLVEKPAPGTAPSNLTNISKYIFTPGVFAVLKEQKPDLQSGEYYITDTATQVAKDNRVVIYKPQGIYLDGGTVLNWLKANLIVAKDNPELKTELQKFLAEEF